MTKENNDRVLERLLAVTARDWAQALSVAPSPENDPGCNTAAAAFTKPMNPLKRTAQLLPARPFCFSASAFGQQRRFL